MEERPYRVHDLKQVGRDVTQLLARVVIHGVFKRLRHVKRGLAHADAFARCKLRQLGRLKGVTLRLSFFFAGRDVLQ